MTIFGKSHFGVYKEQEFPEARDFSIFCFFKLSEQIISEYI